MALGSAADVEDLQIISMRATTFQSGLERIANLHVSKGDNRCGECQRPWPCATLYIIREAIKEAI